MIDAGRGNEGRPASGFDRWAEIVSEIAWRRIEKALSQNSLTLIDAKIVPSITDCVFEGFIQSKRVIVKCGLAGQSRTRLAGRLREGTSPRVIAAEAEIYAAQLSANYEAECYWFLKARKKQLQVHIPDILCAHRDVVIVEHVGQDTILDRPDTLEQSLPQMWKAMSALWRAEYTSSRESRMLRFHQRRSIEGTFFRKFAGDLEKKYVDELLTDRASRACVRAMIQAIGPTGARVNGLPRVLFGDLKPEHVVISPTGSLSLIDPAIRCGEPIEDTSRFVMRTLMAPVTDTVRWRMLDSALTSVPKLSARHLFAYMAMDWVNILTTRLQASKNKTGPRAMTHVEMALTFWLIRAKNCTDFTHFERLNEFL